MKKLTVLLLFVFFLQGCSCALPRKQIIMLPKNLDIPAVLVHQGNQLSALSIDGKISNLTGMIASDFSNLYETKTKIYFLANYRFPLFSSLWVFDRETRSISCLIPLFSLPSSMEYFLISPDDLYFYFSSYVHSNSGNDSHNNYTLYSIKNNQKIEIPVSKGELIANLFPTGSPNEFVVVTEKNSETDIEKQDIYYWNTESKEKKLIVTCDQYEYKRNSAYIAVIENNVLILYSIKSGEKVILQQKITDCDFEFVGSKPYLLIREYGQNPKNPKCSFVSPDNVWKPVQFSLHDIISSFRVFSSNVILFSINNPVTGFSKIIRWDPDTNETNLLCQNKNVTYEFEYTSDPDRYVLYKGINKISKKNHYAIVDTLTNEVKEFTTSMFFDYSISHDGTKWLFKTDYGDLIPSVQELMVFDWKLETQTIFKVAWDGNFFPNDISNDGRYIFLDCWMSSKGDPDKNLLMNIITCKELPLPAASNLQFITWLE